MRASCRLPGPIALSSNSGLVLLCAAWILLGLFHHDPWKPDDATSFGFVLGMLKSGDWVIPQLAGEASLDRPPLLYALAAGTAKLFGGLIPLHDAARVSIALCLALTLCLIGLSARELYGRSFRWPAILVFIGSIGLWDRAHQLSPDVGLLPAYALALYALALSLRRAALAGVLLGLALGVAFLCKGWFAPAVIVVTAVLLPFFAPWRTRGYAVACALAVAIALPLFSAWPLALYLRDPVVSAGWIESQNVARFLGLTADSAAREPLYYLVNLPWFAWPALPLLLWTLRVRWRGFNGGLRTPGIELPAIMAAVILVAVSVAPEPRAIDALPLLLPLALLGAAEVDTLKRGFSGALDWFGMLTFGMLGTLVWALWLESLHLGLPEPVARLFRDTQPGYQSHVEPFPLAAAIFLTLLWVMLVRPARRSNRRALLNWAAGMTLVWGLYMTIWLPYLDSRRSYRSVAESLMVHLPTDTCVAGRNLGEPQRAMLDYFVQLRTVRADTPAGDRCKALLVQAARSDGEPLVEPGWNKVWEGRRRGDDTERFLLFQRAARPGSQ